jgi:predicted TIM-barrel enzyme
MKKRIIAAIAGGIWLSAVGTAATLSYAITRPVVLLDAARVGHASMAGATQLREAVEETIESSVLEMPTVTIVGYYSPAMSSPSERLRGATEMQRADDLIIGHGVVTHAQ